MKTNYAFSAIRTVQHLCLTALVSLSLFACQSPEKEKQETDLEPVIGRWDLTVDQGDRIVPSWLEIKRSGIRTLVGQFLAEGGSARPVSHIQFSNGKIVFTIPPQWEDTEQYMTLEGEVKDGAIGGVIHSSRGEKHTWTGVRAPSLKRELPPVWGSPINLLNGKDLSGWHPSDKKNQWLVEDGVMKSPESGSNIITDSTFEDFKLHIEFRYPAGSNSGVYLRGRYEIQVEDNRGQEPASTLFGGIYGFITPNEMVAKAPGEWQSFDITLVGRLVTVVANGKTIICDQLIPGITGGALNSREGEPGPIMLQGDHGPIEYRNIILTPAL
jgi:hypothetical protein